MTFALLYLCLTLHMGMQELAPHTSPIFVSAFRLLPAGVALVAWAAASGRKQPKGWQAWVACALFGLVDGTAFQVQPFLGCLPAGAYSCLCWRTAPDCMCMLCCSLHCLNRSAFWPQLCRVSSFCCAVPDVVLVVQPLIQNHPSPALGWACW